MAEPPPLNAPQRDLLRRVREAGRLEVNGRLRRTAQALERKGMIRIVGERPAPNRITGRKDLRLTLEPVP